jgi:hypothetical protein
MAFLQFYDIKKLAKYSQNFGKLVNFTFIKNTCPNNLNSFVEKKIKIK